MKKILYALIFISLPLFSVAQSVETEGEMILSQGSLLNADDDELDVHWDVINTSSDAVNISCSREVISEVSGSRNKFCWGPLCYGWSTDVSPDGMDVLMVPGASNSTFHGYYQHQGNAGETQVKYCFFNVNDSNDEACVTTTFKIFEDAVGVEEIEVANELNNVSPNPIVGISTFTYTINSKTNNSQIVIYNLIGAVVKVIPLNANQGVVILNGQDFETGIYLYSLIVDGQKVSTKRLVVAK